MTNKITTVKTKFSKHSETLGSIISGFEDVIKNKYMKITPFSKIVSSKKSKIHPDTVKLKLTDMYLSDETLKRLNIEFFLDENNFVEGFIIRDEKETIDNLKNIEEKLLKIEDKIDKLINKKI